MKSIHVQIATFLVYAAFLVVVYLTYRYHMGEINTFMKQFSTQ